MPHESLDIDVKSFTAKGRLPRCPFCGAVARPNVYMFGDSEKSYVWEAGEGTARNFAAWIEKQKDARLLILEIGCGLGAPGLRHRAERYLATYSASSLIRINLAAAEGPSKRFIGIRAGAAQFFAELRTPYQ